MGLDLHIIAEHCIDGRWEIVPAPGHPLGPCRDYRHAESMHLWGECFHCGGCDVEPSQWWHGRTWQGVLEALLDGGREDYREDHIAPCGPLRLDGHGRLGVVDEDPDTSIRSLAPHREVASNLSAIGRIWERACGDAVHGTGWATLTELRAFDWQATFVRVDHQIEAGVHAAWVAAGRVGRPPDNPWSSGAAPTYVRDEWRETYALASEGFYEMIDALALAAAPAAGNDVRIVWWRH